MQGQRREAGDDKLFTLGENPGEDQKSARSDSVSQQAPHLHQLFGQDVCQNKRILTG